MKVFEPKIEIRLVKSSRREELAPGIATATRYRTLSSLDLTPYLSDGTPVQVGKSVREPAGAWSLSLVDRMVPGMRESLYALIEPMDMVEFRLAHNPADQDYAGVAGAGRYQLPVVMRGFVSSVTRTRGIEGGEPMRMIQVSGHDFGKILQILRIYYLNNSVIGDNIIAELKFFQKYAGAGDAKIMQAAEFVQLVLDKVINPYIVNLTLNADGKDVAASVVQKLTAEVSIPGAVSPDAVSNLTEVSVHQFLSQLLDVGPFNELYLEERPDSVALVVRPNPFLGVHRKPIQDGPAAEVVEIDTIDVESISESRTDAGVANYYWVTNGGWQLIMNQPMRELAAASPQEDYAPFNYVNCHSGRYGFRKMEVASSMGPTTLRNSDATPATEVATENDKLLGWLVDRRHVLAAQNKDNVVFESGSMRVRGNERIKAGAMLAVRHGSTRALYYVTHVAHEFLPYNSFKTTVMYERGTGFIDRAQQAVAPYLAEMNVKGAV